MISHNIFNSKQWRASKWQLTWLCQTLIFNQWLLLNYDHVKKNLVVDIIFMVNINISTLLYFCLTFPFNVISVMCVCVDGSVGCALNLLNVLFKVPNCLSSFLETFLFTDTIKYHWYKFHWKHIALDKSSCNLLMKSSFFI